MLRLRPAVLAVAFGLLVACAAKPPPRWAEGGQSLVIPRARWERHGEVVDILPDGRVLVDGEHAFTVDGAGRVYEPNNEPVSVLEPDGRLRGKDDADLGEVGLMSAAPKGSKYAWVVIAPNGHVTTYDEEGRPRHDGVWSGCVGESVQTCTLVSHLLVERHVRRAHGPRFGIGIGVIMPIR